MQAIKQILNYGVWAEFSVETLINKYNHILILYNIFQNRRDNTDHIFLHLNFILGVLTLCSILGKIVYNQSKRNS